MVNLTKTWYINLIEAITCTLTMQSTYSINWILHHFLSKNMKQFIRTSKLESLLMNKIIFRQ